MLELSVIIPTHNRAEILSTCLEKLLENQFPKTKYEIIIVNDGSTDNTEEVVKEIQKEHKQIRYFKQKKMGQGVARNLGMKEAKSEIILLIGDDIFVNKTFLEQHYKTHRLHPEKNYACLGLILWDPTIKISPLMEWLTNGSSLFGRFGGHQFAYEKLENKEFADYNFFYTSNISLKKRLLEKNQFDPWFDGYGWEDIELAYRLEKKENLKILYNPHAVGHHHHEISLENFKSRMISIGKAAVAFENKHPEINKVPKGFKKFIFQILGNSITVFLLKIASKLSKQKLQPLYFYALSKKYFMIGLKQQIS